MVVTTAQNPEIELPALGSGPFLATDQSHWSIFRNMAGMAEMEEWQAVFGYQHPFGLSTLQSLAIGFIYPGKPALGLSLFQSGKDQLVHQQVSLNGSIELQDIKLGIRTKYWSSSIPGIRSLHNFTLALGMQIELTSDLLAGIYIGNVTGSRLGVAETLPITWYLGLRYQPTAHINILAEAGHILGYIWHYKSGLEVMLKQKLFARAGFNSSNRRAYFGLGFLIRPLKLDYALDIHPHLGFTHQAGLGYSWP